MFFQSKLHTNSILTGSVDSYCLVCDNYLRSEDEAYTHTEKPIHKKNVGAAVHVEKYKNDQIIKVKKGYYCSYCNILLSTTTKVGLHISDNKHQENKGAQMLNRLGDNVIAFDEVAIRQEAWHGMMDNTCVVCNMEFDEEVTHRSDLCHVLKLIQSTCEFGDKYVYRKVDGDSFYCLICGNVFSIEDKPDHHEDSKHKILYNTGKELKNTTPVLQLKTETDKVLLVPKTVKTIEDIVNESPDAEDTKTSDAASAKKKVADKNHTDAAPKKANVNAADTTKQADTNNGAGTAKSKDAKNTNGSDTTKSADAKKTNGADTTKSADAKKTNNADTVKPEDAKETGADDAKTTHDSNNHVASNIPKAEGFTENGSKIMDINKDPRMREYLKVNNYMVHEEGSLMRCVMCDLRHIKIEDVKAHCAKDPHHQMMLKKHGETLIRTANGPTARINETFPFASSVKNGDLKNPEHHDNNVTESNGILKEECTASQQPPLDVQSKISQQNPDNNIDSDQEDNDKSKILDNVDKYQRNDINIDFTSEKARCKQCAQYVTFSFACLEKHVLDHKSKKALASKNKQLDTKTKIETLVRENFMDVFENEVYCKPCSSGLALNLKVLLAHVNLSSHKDKLISINGTEPVKKGQAFNYIKIFVIIQSNLGLDVVVNSSYLLTYHSFHCVTKNEENYTCRLCNVFSEDCGDQLTQHLNSAEHKQKMGQCSVVISLPEEFIREVTPELYHCGYCNQVSEPWQAMQDHLLSSKHVSTSLHARWNLERCNAVVRNARPQQISDLHAVNFA